MPLPHVENCQECATNLVSIGATRPKKESQVPHVGTRAPICLGGLTMRRFDEGIHSEPM